MKSLTFVLETTISNVESEAEGLVNVTRKQNKMFEQLYLFSSNTLPKGRNHFCLSLFAKSDTYHDST